MLYGYARLSSTDQDTRVQVSTLRVAGCEVIRIDRLARSIGDLQDIARTLKTKGVALKATEQPIDTSTAAGKAFLDLLGVFAEFETMRRIAMHFHGILRSGDVTALRRWLDDAHHCGIHAMQRFARTLQRDLDAVQNALTTDWSNGQTEGQISQLKTLKRVICGRAGTELLRARMLPF